MADENDQETSGPIGTIGVDISSHKRFKLLACEIIHREACLLAAQSRNVVDVEFLGKGLHDRGKECMVQTIQEAVNAVATKDYDAILLGYGRCNDGIVGLRAVDIPDLSQVNCLGE